MAPWAVHTPQLGALTFPRECNLRSSTPVNAISSRLKIDQLLGQLVAAKLHSTGSMLTQFVRLLLDTS
jgi:hypothetical protein